MISVNKSKLKVSTDTKTQNNVYQKDETDNENNWYYMLPGEKRMDNAENSNRNSVIEMLYHYKDFDTFHSDYRKMILTALQQTISTFKQNLRVINNRVNYYQAEPNTKRE